MMDFFTFWCQTDELVVAVAEEGWSLMWDENERNERQPSGKHYWHTNANMTSQISAEDTTLQGTSGTHGSEIAYNTTESQTEQLHFTWRESTAQKEDELRANKLLLQVIILNCLHFVSHCSQ